jgi:bud site selection protein 20
MSQTAYLTCHAPVRLKILKEEPHSQELAERAIGLGVPDNGKRSKENPDAMED